jgi:hypothetical protein
MRFYPSYTFETPATSQQRIGNGGMTQWKSSNPNSASIRIGSSNTLTSNYSYVGFNTGHSEQNYLGYMVGISGTHATHGAYGGVVMRPPVMTDDAYRPYITMAEYGAATAGRSYISIGIDDNSVTNQSQNVTNWYRLEGGTYSQANYGDAWYWFDNPTTGTSWTTLMSLNASGNLTVAGSLSKGSGSFDIPHPIAEDKRLRHSFIEGPYADLIYRGTVTLGSEPTLICMDTHYDMTEGTWKALNTNPWSMVSASGKLVEWSLDECELTITGDEGTVCQWMVIGERKDPHMIDADISDNDGRIVLEYTPTAEPEDIHDQPLTPDYR